MGGGILTHVFTRYTFNFTSSTKNMFLTGIKKTTSSNFYESSCSNSQWNNQFLHINLHFTFYIQNYSSNECFFFHVILFLFVKWRMHGIRKRRIVTHRRRWKRRKKLKEFFKKKKNPKPEKKSRPLSKSTTRELLLCEIFYNT